MSAWLAALLGFCAGAFVAAVFAWIVDVVSWRRSAVARRLAAQVAAARSAKGLDS